MSPPRLPRLGGGGSKAAVSLTNSSATLTQTSTTAWNLFKTGSVDTADHTVTWNVAATQGATESGILIINGFMTVTNSGTAGATIGNIVVNLQGRSTNKWITRSSDIADATDGDGATTATVVASANSENKSSFSENSTSGRLLFMDASNNTVFALVPEVTIAPGASRKLLFSAAFDNEWLGLAVGAAVRAEVIVSFGNSGPSGVSAPNIDINGNGVIDTDETYVRSIATRIGLTVPTETPSNAEVTLSDTASDIATTGTVTFSNASFNLGASGGTVSVSYAGGTDGGTITNCAHLTGSGGSAVNLQACDTETIETPTCTPGTAGCGWSAGDVITYSEGGWGSDPTPTNAAGLLQANYGTVYASTLGILELGIPGGVGFSILFTNVTDLLGYLPASGAPGPLTSDLIDPSSTASGDFGGHVAALRLNIDFADAGLTGGASSARFGDLTLCGFTVLPGLNGLSVREYQDVVNTLLGGGASIYPIAALGPVTDDLNLSFGSGSVSLFAQDHLVVGACP